MTKAYMEKENTFGIFLKEHRLKLEVTLEQLSEGLCSVSELARIEAGSRAAGKALQDRLLYRLGISPDLYEIFLFQDDYSRWKKRQQLLYAVTRMSAEEAGRLLLEYREQYEDAAKADVDRRLERQFCLTMEAQILRNRTNETEQPGLHRLQEKGWETCSGKLWLSPWIQTCSAAPQYRICPQQTGSRTEMAWNSCFILCRSWICYWNGSITKDHRIGNNAIEKCCA